MSLKRFGPSQGKGKTRLLFYFPILHTEADMGTLRGPVHRLKLSRVGARSLARDARLVSGTWDAIEHVLEKLDLPAGKVRIYQDGLPVCGQERRVVSELAEAGSRNHQLLLRLLEWGAMLMGTESPELLVEEYQLAIAALTPKGVGAVRRSANREESLSASLLQRRDQFIASRINETLEQGETGVLFIGMLHCVDRYLNTDIRVVFPTKSGADADSARVSP